MGLFLLRRSSPMSSLEAEVSQTTGKAILSLIAPGHLCNPESLAPSRRARAVGQEGHQGQSSPIRFLPTSCQSLTLSGSHRQHCLAPKTSSVIWGNEVSSADSAKLQLASGIADSWVGKPPARRQTELNTRVHLPETVLGVSDADRAPPHAAE